MEEEREGGREGAREWRTGERVRGRVGGCEEGGGGARETEIETVMRYNTNHRVTWMLKGAGPAGSPLPRTEKGRFCLTDRE